MSTPEAPLIHIFDFEGNAREGILEYGKISLQNGQLIQPETQFFHHQRPVEIFSKKEKIHRDDIENAPDIQEKFADFQQWRRTGFFAAHGAKTEDSLLRKTWASPGKVPSFLETNFTISWGPWIDSERLYRLYFPELSSYKLRDLIQIFQLEIPLRNYVRDICPPNRQEFHCALFDTIATGFLLRELQIRYGLSAKEMLLQSMPNARRQNHQQPSLF